MITNFIINNISINFHGPLFTFLNGGQPRPRAGVVLSLSLGHRNFLRKIRRDSVNYVKYRDSCQWQP